jgi:hypothetical protein
MIPDEAVEAALWLVLVTAGYSALVLLVPADEGLWWALAGFTALVAASGAWMVTELRKKES